MASEILSETPSITWPSGDPIMVRVGVATGPVVAGVIGERKFAYDVWGDTVNLASRLEEYSEPGRAFVSERTAVHAIDGFAFEPVRMVDIKGKGPTPVHVLVGPNGHSHEGASA
jgi:class 3 adenylate cyclase